MRPYDYEDDGYPDELPAPNCGDDFHDHEVVLSVDSGKWQPPRCLRCGAVLRWPNEATENAGRPFQSDVIARYSDTFIVQALENPGASPATREFYRRELQWRSLAARIEATE